MFKLIRIAVPVAVACIVVFCANAASAQLRIVTYNISAADNSGGALGTGFNTVLQGIGAESVNGIAKPLDVLAIQEDVSQATTGQQFVNMLNGIYGSGVYARGTLDGGSTGSGTQGIIYNTNTVQLVAEKAVGVSSSSGQSRQELRYQLRPVGYGSTADFYLYSGHYKAGNASTDLMRKNIEAQAVRADADALGQGAHIILAGDYNSYSSSEPEFATLFAAGAGQTFDPLNRPGSWDNNNSFVDIDTQAPAVNAPMGMTGGGLDDRFDFQLLTDEVLSGTTPGLRYLAGSYHAFGNNGSVPLNAAINDSRSTALAGLANRQAVLDALTTATDHLPVVADYTVVVPEPTTLGMLVIAGITLRRSRRTRVGNAQTRGALRDVPPDLRPTTMLSIEAEVHGLSAA